MARIASLVLAVAALEAAAFAQPAPPASTGPEKTVQRVAPILGCDRVTVADGLPHSNVTAIVQDRRGFVWLGTQDGLARSDGIKLRVYRSLESDPTTVSQGNISSLTLDASGKLWVSTGEHGLSLYDPDTDKFTRFTAESKGGLSSEGITTSYRDAKDRVWFGMSGGGLDRFDPATNAFVVPKVPAATYTAIDGDPDGNLWLGTLKNGVIKWNPDSSKAITYDPEELGITGDDVKVTAIKVARGKVWIGTSNQGLVVLDPSNGKRVRERYSADDANTITDDHISVIFEDRDNILWVGTHNGLNQIDAGGGIVRYVPDPNSATSLPFPWVWSLYQDAGGVMWAGGFSVGVCRFDKLSQQFGLHRIRQNFTTAFFEDPDGTLWVGTYDDGLYKYQRDAKRVTIYHELRNRQDGQPGTVPLESKTWVTALHRDRKGTLWLVLKGRGLVAFDTKAETYREYVPDAARESSLPVDELYDIWEDDRGDLWLASFGAGLVHFDPKTEEFTSYDAETKAVTSNYIYTLHSDPADKKVLWVGTAKGGLVRYNLANRTSTSFRHDADDVTTISHDDILSIYIDPQGIVWLGTYGGGLNRLDPKTGKAERFTTSNSILTNDGVLGILADDTGKLWISTNGGGILQFDPATKRFVETYDHSDGLQDNEFNQGSFYRSKAGELFFGGSKGFNAFFPQRLQRDSYRPPVVFTAFKILGEDVKLERPVWTLPKIQVSYTDSFEIQFAALAFAAPKRNRFAYKLDGFDDKFIETDRPFASYSKLDGGKYTLRVRASNRHGEWTEIPIALSIAVSPPWWRTWQAFIGYLVVLAGGVLMLFRIQRERVLKAEREGRLAVVERDLELTGAVQSGFLPELNEISTKRLQLYGFYRPADACGGDWWWHEPLMGGRHIVMVGDVTGHGPGPAMVTAAVATAFRVLIENGLDDPEQGLHLLNREVLRVAKGKYHMTMAALELEENTGRWVLHNAGAPPILSLSQQGKHRVHFCPGAPLGTESGFQVGRVEGRLEPTERILIYTDGIPEIILPNGNVLGMRRFAQLYERTRGQQLREVAATILKHADQTRGTEPQLDDWTFTLIEWG